MASVASAEFLLYANQRYVVYRAAINASSNGANHVVAGIPNRKLIVMQYKRIASDTVTATWESSGGSTLDGPCALAANGGESVPYSEIGHFETVAGEGLDLFLGSGVQVGGSLSYIVV